MRSFSVAQENVLHLKMFATIIRNVKMAVMRLIVSVSVQCCMACSIS